MWRCDFRSLFQILFDILYFIEACNCWKKMQTIVHNEKEDDESAETKRRTFLVVRLK